MSVKKIVFFSVIILSLFIINSLIHSIYNLWQKKDLVVKAKQDLVKEKKENEKLKKKLTDVKQPQFVEEEARNKLFLAKPGEGVIVIPTEYTKTSTAAIAKPVDTRPNWQQWWDLFF